MKKTSMLAALALVATIGGAYATWNYAGTKVDTVTHEKSIVITDATTTTTHGRVHVHADTLALSIDDISNTQTGFAKYTPGWNPTINNANGGKLWIDFVPNVGAPASVSFEYTITLSGNLFTDTKDNGDEEQVPIFNEVAGSAVSGDTATIVVTTTKALDLTKTADNNAVCSGSYLIEDWTVEEVMGLLKLNQSYTLGDLEEYNAFKKHLAEELKITVTVTDVTVTA